MKIRNIDTNQIEELRCMSRNGVENMASDLTASDTEIDYNRETMEYEATAETIEWWKEKFEKYEKLMEMQEEAKEHLTDKQYYEMLDIGMYDGWDSLDWTIEKTEEFIK